MKNFSGSYLSDPLLHRGLCDETIDHYFPILTNTMSSAEGLKLEKKLLEKNVIKKNCTL